MRELELFLFGDYDPPKVNPAGALTIDQRAHLLVYTQSELAMPKSAKKCMA